MTGFPGDSNFIGIPAGDRNKPVYRVVSFRRLIEFLVTRNLVLISPSRWDDPFENWLLRGRMETQAGTRIGFGMKDCLYGQCWTWNEESDAMWRIYSPTQDGARIRSTPEKLLTAIGPSIGETAAVTAFIGAVEYVKETELADKLDPLRVLDQTGAGIARALLLKRREFEHEKEVRLIHLAADANGGDFLGLQVDPISLIDEVAFDPRMGQLDVESSTAVLARLGFTNGVTQSQLYKPPQDFVRKLSEVEGRALVSGMLDRRRNVRK